MKKDFRDVILIVLYSLFLYASAYSGKYDEYITRRNIFFFAILVVILLTYKNLKLTRLSYWKLWIGMSLIIIISNFPESASIGTKMAVVPILYGVLLYDKNIIWNVSLSTLIVELIILYQSLSNNKIVFGFFYTGIYDNPNTFGASMAALFIAAVIMFVLSDQLIAKIFFVVIAFAGFYYELLSFCRSALLTSIVILFMFAYMNKDKLLKHRNILIALVLIATVILMLFINKYDSVIEFIRSHVYKWGESSASTLSSSRVEMWEYVFRNLTLLGTTPAFAPHSNYVMAFYDYGAIAGFLYILFCILVLFNYIRKSKENESKAQRVACIILMITYICMGLFEESFGFTGKEWMFLGYIGYGYAINRLLVLAPEHHKIRFEVGKGNYL